MPPVLVATANRPFESIAQAPTVNCDGFPLDVEFFALSRVELARTLLDRGA